MRQACEPPPHPPRPTPLLLFFFPLHHNRTAQLQTFCTFCIASSTTTTFAPRNQRLCSRIFLLPALSDYIQLLLTVCCTVCRSSFIAAVVSRCKSLLRALSRCNRFPLQSFPAGIVSRCNFCLSLDRKYDLANPAAFSSCSPLSFHISFYCGKYHCRVCYVCLR
jgi:hypothetical protein